MNPQILNFLKETANRLLGRSSKYFLVWQVALSIMIILGRVPWALERWTDIVTSEHFINFCKDISTFAAGAITFLALTSDSKPAAVTQDGTVVKKVDNEKYPFTAAAEKKKGNGDVPVIPENVGL